MNPINLKEKIGKISGFWHPHQIAGVDEMQVLLAKVSGEFVWHSHEDEDELFLVLEGTLIMQFRDRTERINEGELIVVPKGVPHCPATEEGREAVVLLFEKKTTAHTGKVKDALTQTEYPKI